LSIFVANKQEDREWVRWWGGWVGGWCGGMDGCGDWLLIDWYGWWVGGGWGLGGVVGSRNPQEI